MPVIEPKRTPSTTSSLDKYESATSSLIQSRTSSEISSKVPADNHRNMLKTRSATPMDPIKRQRLLDLKSQLYQLLSHEEDIDTSSNQHVAYMNGHRHHSNHVTNTVTTTIPNTTTTTTNTSRMSSQNDENERMDRLERSIERIQAQV